MQRATERSGRRLVCFLRPYHSRWTMKRRLERDGEGAEDHSASSKQRLSLHEMMTLRMKQKLGEKRTKYGNKYSSHVSIKVLSTGAVGSTPSLFVSTDYVKFLFNCGEGVQRLANEHKCRMSRLEHVFTTTASWRNIGGMPGMFLTLQGMGIEEVTVHGPEGISDIGVAITKFVSLNNLRVLAPTEEQKNFYEDKNVLIRPVRLRRPGSGPKDRTFVYMDVARYYQKWTAAEEKQRKNEVGTLSPEALQKRQEEVSKAWAENPRPRTTLESTRIEEAVCYVCTRKKITGSLLIEKCLELGMHPGPDMAKLKNGLQVVLPNGTLVTKEDVCAPDEPEKYFLVVECPSLEYLPVFLEEMSKEKLTEMGVWNEQLLHIFHFTSDEIIAEPSYKAWMESVPFDTQHVLMNSGNRCLGNVGNHKLQYQLHTINKEVFPLLKEDCFEEDKEYEVRGAKIFRPRCMQEFMYHLRGVTAKSSFSDTNKVVSPLDPGVLLHLHNPQFVEAYMQLKEDMRNLEKELGDTPEYPKLVMLGTGSSVPNKIRNTSGMLLWLDEKTAMILDCGEGTFGQLVRIYGKDEIRRVLTAIKGIFVSHLHADHHIGLISLLQERYKYVDVPVYLLAPSRLDMWLNYYSNRFENIKKMYKMVDNPTFNENAKFSEYKYLVLSSLGLKNIVTVTVKHPAFPSAIALTLKNDMKVVYSGDTSPCPSLTQLSRNCDLLIHEATMDDNLIAQARTKCHSTVSQAIGTGMAANARFILLTHFSQRYSKIPHMEENGTGAKNIGAAYDYMQVPLARIRMLSLFYPCLKAMFHDYYTKQEGRCERIRDRNEFAS